MPGDFVLAVRMVRLLAVHCVGALGASDELSASGGGSENDEDAEGEDREAFVAGAL